MEPQDMMNSVTYIQLLKQSLRKKLEVLNLLLQLTEAQDKLFDSSEIDVKKFDELITSKNEQIKQLSMLDNGFEQIYSHVKEELNINKLKYKEEIEELQSLVTDITDSTIKLEVMERRNSEKLKLMFSKKRNEIKSGRKNNQMVTNYYKNMSGSHDTQSFFYDKKN